LRKFIIFLVVSIGFGFYGLYDATIAYPKRGERDASYRLLEYLRAADDAHGLALPLGIPDGQSPQQYLDALHEREQELFEKAGGEGGAARDARADMAKMTWLDSLGKIYRLTPERVEADLAGNPSEKLAELTAEWETKDQPKPLAWFDIPVQWLFTVVGFGLGLWLTVHMLRVARKTYTWEPNELRLGLPGGESIVPSDVAEFDRRKWDKFLYFFKIKPDHAGLGGKEIKLDLYQYAPLEDWCVAMHKHARPEDFADEAQDDADEPSDAAAESDDLNSQEASEGSPESEPRA
ncbi:MAG: hypothetical protein AAFN41_03975, partial [Planctomycetota bacterium]